MLSMTRICFPVVPFLAKRHRNKLALLCSGSDVAPFSRANVLNEGEDSNGHGCVSMLLYMKKVTSI